MTEEIRVYRKHLRQVTFCRKGSRAMADRIGVDWDRFMREGIPVSELEKIDDVAVQKLVKHVKDTENGNG